MNVRKTDDFIADVERQYRWYVVEAGTEIATSTPCKPPVNSSVGILSSAQRVVLLTRVCANGGSTRLFDLSTSMSFFMKFSPAKL